MEISKKDLLKETNISYGQLYRWKREGLIPEEWFIKKSTFTGQETFFPKAEILERIERIQLLKDEYSLEDLAKMLSPEMSNRIFQEDELEKFMEIDVEIVSQCMDLWEKDTFTYIEILWMIALQQFQQAFPDQRMDACMKQCKKILQDITSIDTGIALLKIESELYLCSFHGSYQPTFDDRIEVLMSVCLKSINQSLKLQYREQL